MAELRPTSNEELMKTIGSKKGSDPIPPDQYLTYTNKRYPPVLRLWAWMLSKTIRHGHRSPWAVDTNRTTLTLADAAQELKMDKANTYRAWKQLEDEGRVRKDGKRLTIRGDVKLPIDYLKDEPQKVVCTNYWPPYISLQINRLEKSERETFERRAGAIATFGNSLKSDLIAAARDIVEQQQDTLFSQFGIKKIAGKKHRETRSQFLPIIEQSAQPLALQILGSELVVVQTTSVCTTDKNADVQTPAAAPSYMSYTEEQRKEVQAAGSIEGSKGAPTPESLPPANLSQELARRKLSVGSKMLTKIVATLNECPVFYFLEVLDRRAERGAIGTGLLAHIAEDAAREYQAMCTSVDEVA